MAGKRQPTDVVMANGRKHLSKNEEAERRSGEVRLPPSKTARPPKWLPEYLKKDFRVLGKKLIAAGIYTDLDSDTLGRYLVAHHQWTAATDEVQKYLDERNSEEADVWGRIQERYFKQARNCANDMGLTVTSRCRLVVPPANKQSGEEDNPFLRLIQGGAEKRA
ncbi:MAG: phage terminase small subunit P27 family [Lawsonibacter sp.]|nr:phage terminase small subunit P27 family [Lawsonibacter sp.]